VEISHWGKKGGREKQMFEKKAGTASTKATSMDRRHRSGNYATNDVGPITMRNTSMLKGKNAASGCKAVAGLWYENKRDRDQESSCLEGKMAQAEKKKKFRGCKKERRTRSRESRILVRLATAKRQARGKGARPIKRTGTRPQRGSRTQQGESLVP